MRLEKSAGIATMLAGMVATFAPARSEAQYVQQQYPQQQYVPQQQYAPQQYVPQQQYAPVQTEEVAAPGEMPPVSDWPFAPHVAFRLGHFLPTGGLEDRLELADNVGGLTMFFLSAGARVENVVVDLTFGIGGAGIDGPLRDHIAMSGFEPGGALGLYFGVEGYYQFFRGSDHVFYPFVGLGLGYEGMLASGTMGDWNLTRSYGTFQLRPMIGADWAIVPAFAIGLSLEAGIGFFGDVTEEAWRADDPITFENESDSIEMELRSSGGVHAWIGGTVRVVIFP